MMLGQDLTFITDYKSLTFLKRCKLLSAQLTRWILYLQEYDFKIEHCRSMNNETANILSRYPVKGSTGEDFPKSSGSIETYVTTISAEFREVQKRLQNICEERLWDEWCGTIIARVNSNDCPEKIKDLYIVYNQILFRREPKSEYEWGYLVCVPANLIESIVLHFGSEKCFIFLKRFYYWPKINKGIRQTLTACNLCQKTKISHVIEGKMHHVFSEKPKDIPCLDLMEPLAVLRGGATQFLVTVNAFSKFVKLYPLRRATTKAILNKLQNDYFLNYGTPQKILSDNGTQFSSQT
ncbi:hypothetical protein ILUMI_18335 [Ignelater luminosus]|uniref:RNA-directed DNA polymerase n=1 Tax=Ignelater luminosus TaxID=2038154 RepID=A0A8K0CNT0_IGNLU|nr:hypothetical protein ILUMI_18335 [Ignelater luminosus]